MSRNETLNNRLIRKLSLAFFFIIVFMGACYILITIYLTNKHFEERTQKLNANLAGHLIEEKFQNGSPFFEDGRVNSAFFGDVMHDMMAVNRGIEVYLVDSLGSILYSVVLDHDNPNDPVQHIDLNPVRAFIESKDQYILGDDPRDKGRKKIFSAAKFSENGNTGYIYIVLAGQEYQVLSGELLSGYFMKLGLGAALMTMVFVLSAGLLSIWFLTKNVRSVVSTVKRFREGDMKIRIENPEKTDLSVLAINFNDMADTIARNMEEIQSIDVLRRELIANVSHDLRTPLSIINGYIETLQIKNKELSEEEKERYLEIIKGSSQKLTHLVAQLFEYSKLEAEQIKPEKEPFAITDLAMDLVAKYQLMAGEKDIEIKMEAENDIPLVFADISLVERVIQNLLDNALKFTPEKGKVSLNITSTQRDVRIEVTDNGPGIGESEQALIFDRYRRSERHSRADGAGLGLAIVKKIMDLHNTSIRVISKPDQGSTFQFELPGYSVAGV
ncbi:MAG: HAMP domain-containing sensor histidine kinase [Cyclobacteriaceae bacterium]